MQSLRGATKKYNSLPSSEKEAIDRKVEHMTTEVERHEEGKIRDGKNMISAISKDVADYCHKKIVNDVGYMRFNGLGRKSICSICGAHDGIMSNMADLNWYCQKHKSLWNLKEKDKQNERSKYVS